MSEKINLKRWGIRRNIRNFYGTARERDKKKKREREGRGEKDEQSLSKYIQKSPRLKVKETCGKKGKDKISDEHKEGVANKTLEEEFMQKCKLTGEMHWLE